MTRRPRLEFAVELRPARIEEFWKRGFTSIQRITTDEELVWLAKVYDRLFVAIREPGRGWLDSEIDDALRGLPFASTLGACDSTP
jgi:hypothetical protein